jgi:hypothetical protein
MIEHAIVYSDKMMQSNWLLFHHPESPVSDWPYQIHDIPDDTPFILCCEE